MSYYGFQDPNGDDQIVWQTAEGLPIFLCLVVECKVGDPENVSDISRCAEYIERGFIYCGIVEKWVGNVDPSEHPNKKVMLT